MESCLGIYLSPVQALK